MLDHDGQGEIVRAAREVLVPTPTDDFSLPRRYADFVAFVDSRTTLTSTTRAFISRWNRR